MRGGTALAGALAALFVAAAAPAAAEPISFEGTVPAVQIAAQLAAQLPPVADRTRSIANTPPGNNGYMDAASFAKSQASGDCNDQNPHFCDWEECYRDY